VARRYYRDPKTGKYKDAKGRVISPPTERGARKDSAGNFIDSAGKRIPRADVQRTRREPPPERQYVWHPKEKKFRDGAGHFRKAPKGRQVKRDDQGRPIDYRGHLVPVEQVTPAPKAPKARTKTYTPSGWRHKGKFTSAPKSSQVRRDSEGYPLDAHGRRVPMDAVRPDKVPAQAARTDVQRIGLGDTNWKTAEHLRLDEAEQHFRNFSNMNRQSLYDRGESKAQEVFTEALQGHLDKGGFERDEVTLYDFGVLLRPQDRTIDESFVTLVRERLAGTGASVTIVQEGPGQDAMMIQLGDDKLPVSADNVEAQVGGASQIMEGIYDEWLEWFDDEPMWAVFWDSDEEMY
jgi:hypothetical protein